MSASEIIEEIKKLPREEQQKVFEFLDELSRVDATKAEAGISESFKRAANEVFTTNAELFQNLA